MECNRDEAFRAKSIAEKKLESKDFAGAKKFALKAQSLYPGLDGISHMVTTIDVYISAENKIGGEVDWYGVLGVTPTADDDAIRKQYRKLALLLHPDKNRTVGADGAFKLICEAWSLLSDKSKRLAYNMRRSPTGGFQPNVPSHAGGQSVPAQANGYHNYKVKTPSAPKAQNNSARMFPKEGPRPSPRTDTFWTICHRCKMQYEYLKVYLNHTLLCPNCHEAFLATETAPPFHSKPSNLGPGHQHQNSSNPIPSRNFFDSRTNAASSAKDSGPLRGFHSPTSGHVSQDRFSRTANVGNTDPSIAAKAARVVQQAHQKIKREREVEGEGLSNKVRRGEDGFRFGANNSNQWTGVKSGSGMSGAALPRKDGFEFQAFPGAYSKPLSTRDLTAVETRNMLMGKARKEILKKLNEWKKSASSKAMDPEKPKVKERKKEDERSTQVENGHVKNGFVVSSSDQVVVEVKKTALSGNDDDIIEEPAESMNVPDPDFHDFDLDRVESSFGDNEVWAAYDDDDGMPRYYAMVNKVISRKPFKLRISWLNSRTTNEFGSMDWIGSGFYKTCGEFRFGRYETYKSINSFSHKVKWSKVRGAVQIFPQKGDVWAVYKNWSTDWNDGTPEEVRHKYEMVIVLDDYNEEKGVSVTPLVKVAGFKTVFRPNSDPEIVKRIPREEMLRFSHQVPYYRLTSEEARNAPKGCLELDPAATPLDLLQVVDECGDVKEPVCAPETQSVETAEG
ncbi:OLC1v1027776C1 [Oldenlandia corymbosa var. corymbosa]|uniref:OLC1v1027776C1 n=1 Tax=Oldenlandia corymbosa var. corymbosa TaxID=529605 RepID=A0AAV1CC90_OLDCO|nr:OLC1v1027776C1 [Oldenlandia corymbosa var. corymbosa]